MVKVIQSETKPTNCKFVNELKTGTLVRLSNLSVACHKHNGNICITIPHEGGAILFNLSTGNIYTYDSLFISFEVLDEGTEVTLVQEKQ